MSESPDQSGALSSDMVVHPNFILHSCFRIPEDETFYQRTPR